MLEYKQDQCLFVLLRGQHYLQKFLTLLPHIGSMTTKCPTVILCSASLAIIDHLVIFDPRIKTVWICLTYYANSTSGVYTPVKLCAVMFCIQESLFDYKCSAHSGEQFSSLLSFYGLH